MKKMLILLGLSLFMSGACQAGEYIDFQCSPSPNKSGISFSNLIGTNFFSEKIADIIIRKEIMKDSTGKYKVNLQSYNLSALNKGIFKSLEVTGTDTITDKNIYASSVKFKTLCDYNHIEYDNRTKITTFKEPFGMSYVISFTEEDLNNTMTGKKYAKIIQKANSVGNSYKLFNIVGSSAKIADNKLYYTMSVKVPLLNVKQDITLETDVKAKSGEIILSDSKLITENFKLDISKLDKILNYLNPLDFSMKILENKGADVHIQDVAIKNNVVNVAGIITIDKDVVTEQ